MLALNPLEHHNSSTGVRCFEEGITYNITISYYPTGGHEWMLDSVRLHEYDIIFTFTIIIVVMQVVLIPDQTDYINTLPIIEMFETMTCLPLDAPVVMLPYCYPYIFDLSLLFYGEVYGQYHYNHCLLLVII